MKILFNGAECVNCGREIAVGTEAEVHPTKRGPRGGKKLVHAQCAGGSRSRRNPSRKKGYGGASAAEREAFFTDQLHPVLEKHRDRRRSLEQRFSYAELDALDDQLDLDIEAIFADNGFVPDVDGGYIRSNGDRYWNGMFFAKGDRELEKIKEARRRISQSNREWKSRKR
jgi:hypothetical protein